MKKLFFALVCFTALILTGCDTNGSGPKKDGIDPSEYTEADIKKLDNKEDKCWCIRSITTIYGEKTKAEEYTWCTEREVAEYCIQAIEVTEQTYKQYGVSADFQIRYYEADADTKADCDKLNKGITPGGGGGGDKACYFFVSFAPSNDPDAYMPYTATQGHVWCNEEELADLLFWYETHGEDAYAWKTPESNQESCEKSKDIPDEALEVMHQYGF